MSLRIAPSLLAADFSHLADEVQEICDAGADLLHLDLMDGCFVPNLSFGPMIVRAVAPFSRIPLDAHLMVENPDQLVPEMAAAGVARLAVHGEACRHIHRSLAAIRDAGMEAGLAINPGTPLEAALAVVPWVDFILVMSVNPGYGGQRFIAESVDRVRSLRLALGDRPLDISVDGGVSADTAGALARAGATTVVAGSSVFGAVDRRRAIAAIRSAAEKGELS